MKKVDESEALWKKEQAENGWVLPKKAFWFLRLPIIRNIRGAVLTIKVNRHARQWASMGIGLGFPNRHDEWVIYAIYRGWC